MGWCFRNLAPVEIYRYYVNTNLSYIISIYWDTWVCLPFTTHINSNLFSLISQTINSRFPPLVQESVARYHRQLARMRITVVWREFRRRQSLLQGALGNLQLPPGGMVQVGVVFQGVSKSRLWFQWFFIFIPIFGEMIQFDEHIFEMAWNH